jgi:protein-disulfide isomerase
MISDKFTIPFAIIIAGGLIAGALYFSNIKAASNAKKPIIENTSTSEIRKISGEDHVLGNPNADILIVEYSDTECPYCKVFHSTLRQIMREYGSSGKVAWVYRHFPIQELHSKARKEAEATECANELGGSSKFWDYINLIYEKTPSNDGLPEAELSNIAKSVGLDVTKFNSCLASGKFAGRVEADYEDAVKSGGTGTPHTILITKDGGMTPVEGAYPYIQLRAVIDSLLGK